ncbi:MAG: CidA/LrgA family protein [Clostridium fessum]
MKYLKEVTIIFGITMLGEFLNYLLPFPVPSGVYGLFILLLMLCTGTLHTEDVAEVGDFFLDTMPIMFIPAGVGLLDSVQEAESILNAADSDYRDFDGICYGCDRVRGAEHYSQKE